LAPSEQRPALSFFENNEGALVDSKLEYVEVPHEFVPQMRNFLRAAAGLEAPINSSLQALQLMEMLDAVYQSSLAGREIVLV
ncbi:MAG: hypothetical protein JOY96_07335, partial [Verrucomicrobia bacterium]|nr:hypothetical protein [Verrucomicrobiota bacterium]